jgi:hypothetical protein
MAIGTVGERVIAQMAKRTPDELRRALWSDEWIKAAMDALYARLLEAERDAVRLYFQALELIDGKETTAILVFCGSLGLSDPDQVRRMVELAKRADGSSETDAYRLAKELVRHRVMADPDERRRAMQEIFGIMDATVMPHTNGHA